MGLYRTLVILHRFLLLGQVMFLGIAVLMVTTGVFNPRLEKLDKYLQITELVVAGVCAFISVRRFASAVEKIRESDTTISERMVAYRAANMAQWMMIETPTIMGIVFFMLTGNYAFAALAFALVLYFAIALRPISLKAAIHLRISEEDVLAASQEG